MYLRSLKGSPKRRSRFTKRAVSEKPSEIGVWVFIVWDRATIGQSNRPHVFDRSCNDLSHVRMWMIPGKITCATRVKVEIVFRLSRQSDGKSTAVWGWGTLFINCTA